MFDKILSLPLKPVTTSHKKLHFLDVSQGFGFASNYLYKPLAINFFRRNVGYLFTKFD